MLRPIQFGLAGGLVFGIMTLVFTLISINTGYAVDWLAVLTSIYPGYTLTAFGAVIGLLYSFAHAFISCYIVALLYNAFTRRVA